MLILVSFTPYSITDYSGIHTFYSGPPIGDDNSLQLRTNWLNRIISGRNYSDLYFHGIQLAFLQQRCPGTLRYSPVPKGVRYGANNKLRHDSD